MSGVEVTPELNRIIAHCLEKNPGERFQSASDLAFHLKSLMTGAAPARAGSGRLEATAKPETPSIAVLPFANLSPDPDQEYFCDGMTEEIITALSKIRGLRVISRNSAMTLKGTRKTTREIGELLHVGHVLEGSVRKSGNNLRIIAQLIDAATDAHLWAERYAGTLHDVFDIQEKVARSIADALRVKLSPDEQHELAERLIFDVRAHECYLRAYYSMISGNMESFRQGERLLRQGLDTLGEHAILYLGLAQIHFWALEFGLEPTRKPCVLPRISHAASWHWMLDMPGLSEDRDAAANRRKQTEKASKQEQASGEGQAETKDRPLHRQPDDSNEASAALKYIRQNYKPDDRLALVVINKKSGALVQRLARAESVADGDTQRWLRYMNDSGYEMYLSTDTVKEDARIHTEEDVAGIRHIYLDLDQSGDRALERLLARSDLPNPNCVLNTSLGRYQVIWRWKGSLMSALKAFSGHTHGVQAPIEQ